jgi:hypothetical protein
VCNNCMQWRWPQTRMKNEDGCQGWMSGNGWEWLLIQAWVIVTTWPFAMERDVLDQRVRTCFCQNSIDWMTKNQLSPQCSDSVNGNSIIMRSAL